MLHLPFRYANRYDFIRPSDCTPRVILPSPSRPPSPLVAPPFPRLAIFFVICTPNRAELLQRYGNDDGVSGGGSSSSRKSQINPFVIPHRSFQPVRISTTSLLCHLRTLLKLFPLFSSVSLLSCQERFYNSTVSICLVPPAYPGLTLPYFRHSFLLSFPHGPSVPCAFASSPPRLPFPFIPRSRIPFA